MLSALLIIAPPAEGALAWDAPAGCPTAEQVEAAIERLLTADASPRMPARATIVAREEAYELTVTVSGETRVVKAATCDPLGSVAALVIAVAHDPISVAAAIGDQAGETQPSNRENDTGRASTRITLPSPSEPAMEPPPPRPARDAGAGKRPSREKARVRVAVAPSLAVGGGVLPGAGVGFGLGLAAFGRRWWRVQLEGSAWLPRRAPARDDPSVGADLWAAGGSLRGCGVPRVAAVEFPLCAGAELDAWIARGRGLLASTDRQTQLYAAAIVGAGVHVQIRRWLALGARAELLASMRRPAVHIDGVGFVFRAHPVAARLVLGPEIRFP
jgi:hypothetical protein